MLSRGCDKTRYSPKVKEEGKWPSNQKLMLWISFWIQRLIHNISFWIQKLMLNISFWLKNFWIQKLILWISLWIQKLIQYVSFWIQKLTNNVSFCSGSRNWHYGSVSGSRNWHYGRADLYAQQRKHLLKQGRFLWYLKNKNGIGCCACQTRAIKAITDFSIALITHCFLP